MGWPAFDSPREFLGVVRLGSLGGGCSWQGMPRVHLDGKPGQGWHNCTSAQPGLGGREALSRHCWAWVTPSLRPFTPEEEHPRAVALSASECPGHQAGLCRSTEWAAVDMFLGAFHMVVSYQLSCSTCC